MSWVTVTWVHVVVGGMIGLGLGIGLVIGVAIMRWIRPRDGGGGVSDRSDPPPIDDPKHRA